MLLSATGVDRYARITVLKASNEITSSRRLFYGKTEQNENMEILARWTLDRTQGNTVAADIGQKVRCIFVIALSYFIDKRRVYVLDR